MKKRKRGVSYDTAGKHHGRSPAVEFESRPSMARSCIRDPDVDLSFFTPHQCLGSMWILHQALDALKLRPLCSLCIRSVSWSESSSSVLKANESSRRRSL